MAGMTAAAIVTGNTVVLKPSSDSAIMAAWFVDLLHEVGVPAGVVNFVPGSGSEIGDSIVAHPKIRFISFHRLERSRSAHQRAGRQAAAGPEVDQARRRRDGRQGLDRRGGRRRRRRGGRRRCGFGLRIPRTEVLGVFARDRRRARFTTSSSRSSAARVAKITVGDPADPKNFMGPVVNEAALHSISAYIEKGKAEGRLIAGGKRVGERGYFLEPTVIADVAPDATIAQEEIFGPVLAVIKARDFDDALAIANNTEFGLTGSLYTQRREEDRAGARGVLRRQPVLQPQEHRGDGRRASRSAASTCPAPTARPAAATTCCSSCRPRRCRASSAEPRQRDSLGTGAVARKPAGERPAGIFARMERSSAPRRYVGSRPADSRTGVSRSAFARPS